MIAGLGVVGVPRGAFIDERNKISLSRFQMLAWTIVALSAYGTIVIARIADNPTTALNVQIPATIWILMGISTTSLVGSPLIKSTKKEATLVLKKDQQDALLKNGGQDPETVDVQGQIVANRDIGAASWSDLFKGEEVSNVTHLDLAKIQMFFFTVLLVLSYAIAVGSNLQAGAIDGLPDVGEGMLALLGISHGGYLMNKAVPSAKPQE